MNENTATDTYESDTDRSDPATCPVCGVETEWTKQYGEIGPYQLVCDDPDCRREAADGWVVL